MDAISLAKQHSERLLQIHMGGLATLGALMLGLGQANLLIPLAVGVGVVVSLWLTDLTGYFRLPRTGANLLALAALVWTLKDVRHWYGMAQVLLISKLLVYLQLILLFQQKDARAYWQLAMISLLEVVVAAAFRQGVLFGLLLLVYFLVGLWTMILFFLYREWEQYDTSLSLPQAVGQWLQKIRTGLVGKESEGPSRAQNTEPEEQEPDGLPPAPTSLCLGKSGSHEAAGKIRPSSLGARWPLAGQSTHLQGGLVVCGGELGWPMTAPVLKITFACWTLTLLLFFLIPRLGSGRWGADLLPIRQAVGFTDQVALGELGRIIQKSDEVLRIRFFDQQGHPYAVEGPLYLRGGILIYYQNGQWRFSRYPRFRMVVPMRKYPLPAYRPYVEQEITIEPMDRQELFCLWPFTPKESDLSVFLDVAHHRLLRPEETCRERFTYRLWTTALAQGAQEPLNPAQPPQPIQAFLQLPQRQGKTAVPSLEALARQWVQQAGIPLENRMNVARLLEARLKFSGRFRYTLHGQPRNPALDPIEDFVREHPEGHCEYFATALALMLRSLGIPSRVVVGYLSDEWNPVGQFFQVRQWHAHMWVEAFLEPEHLPGWLKEGEYGWIWNRGAWLRLDPTPLADPLQNQPFYLRWSHWLHTLWANYVLELDRFRQTEAIYRPLHQSLLSLLQRLQDPHWWSELFRGFSQWAQRFWSEWRRHGWFSWPGFLISFFLGLLLGALLLGWQQVVRLWQERRSSAAPPAITQRVVEFYHRMEQLLANHGFCRAPGQTPREFALWAGAGLAHQLQNPQLAHLPVQLVDAFYQVRFGYRLLDAAQTQQVQHILQTLKKALASSPSSCKKSS